MKKATKIKLLSLILLICLCSSVILSSCGGSAASFEDAYYRPGMTIVIYTIADNVTPEAKAEVEDAVNMITQNKYSTKVVLRYCTAAEYKSVIDSKFAAYDKELALIAEQESIKSSIEKSSREQYKIDKAAGKITEAKTRKTTEPPETTLFIPEKITYEEAGEDQIDIFLITSAEMFAEYAEDKRMMMLDDELNAKSKSLKTYLFPSLLTAAQYGGQTLAIPSNRLIGTATYLLVNKELAEKYELNLSKVKDFDQLVDFLAEVKANEPNVVPINTLPNAFTSYEPLFKDYPLFGVQSAAAKSPIYTPQKEATVAEKTTTEAETETDENGEVVTTEETTTDPNAPTKAPTTTLPPLPELAKTNTALDAISISNIYTAANFTKRLKWIRDFKTEGYTNGAGANANYAVELREGTYEDYLAWEQNEGDKYEFILYKSPVATKEEILQSAFAVSVSAGEKKITRIMEIINLMYTNTEFKNLLQYGVQGIHYNYDDNHQIERLNEEYMMNTYYTGNAFIGDTLVGENPNKWSLAKQHNLNAVNSVFLNFYLDETKISMATVESINALCVDAYNLLTGTDPIPEYVIDEDTGETGNDFDGYLSYVLNDKFTEAGVADFITLIKEQTNPE